jgi:hypothetical protein
MGFWHPGYHGVYDPSDITIAYVPRIIKFTCQLCSASFESQEDLRLHRFENHPFFRPMLFLRGNELGATPVKLTRKLLVTDVLIERTTSVLVNGLSVPIAKVPKLLSGITNDRVTLLLANETVTSKFELDINVADTRDIEGIEKAFLKMARTRSLTIKSIEIFIDECKTFKSASLYCDGICHYLYGVLAKEHASDSGLAFDQYPDRFARAADELQTYEQPLARTIRALVAFNLNYYADAANESPTERLKIVFTRFVESLKGHRWLFADEQSGTDSLLDLLVDHTTFNILKLASLNATDLIRHSNDLKAQLTRDIANRDKFKIQMILAEVFTLQSDSVAMKRLAQELNGMATTQAMALALTARAYEMENSR